jgi:hypothetical protein
LKDLKQKIFISKDFIRRICLSLLVFFPCAVNAQLDNVPENLSKYDRQPIHFGFTLGINSASFVVERVGDFKIRDSIYNVEAERVMGLNLGIVSNLRISDMFDFRFIPALSFGQRNMNYHFIYNDSSEAFTTKKIESTYLEFPFMLKFKSKRVNNYRIYAIAGWKYNIDMVSQAKVKKSEKDIIKLNRNDYGYEIGFGFDFYLEYFKFSPEIKMYNGLKNLLVKENTSFSSPIDALYAKTVVVSLLFE